MAATIATLAFFVGAIFSVGTGAGHGARHGAAQTVCETVPQTAPQPARDDGVEGGALSGQARVSRQPRAVSCPTSR